MYKFYCCFILFVGLLCLYRTKAQSKTLFIEPLQVNVKAEGATVNLKVKSTEGKYNIEIPPSAKLWLKLITQTDSTAELLVKFNNSGFDRQIYLAFLQKKEIQNVQITQPAFLSNIIDKRWLSVAVSSPKDWYGSPESVEVAENVLLYQRNIGGWPKNIPMHHFLTDEEKAKVASEKNNDDAIFDNGATTSEMKFLARMYKNLKDERYKKAFNKGLDFIVKAQYGSSYRGEGGWPQEFPLRGKGYKDRITFNDNAITNLLRLLRDISDRKDLFKDIVDDIYMNKAKNAYGKGVQCILRCQVKENGVKTFWCAQHDEYTLDPSFGRPHELPSYSGAEGVDILRFLMEIDNPSEEIKEAIISAVTWLEKSKIPNKKVIDIKDGNTIIDKKIVDAEGEDLWPRFVQIGGDVGKRIYSKLLMDLDKIKRDGFSMRDNVISSYNDKNAGKAIYGIYDNKRPIYLYRFLYNYEDTPFVNDAPTSLDANARKSYLFIGNWGQQILKTAYPAWKKKNGFL